MAQLVCPYCFERFAPGELAFRCLNPNASRCPREEDGALAVYQRRVSPDMLARVFVPRPGARRAPTEAVCICGTRTTKSVCPRCHNDLPSQFGTTDSYTVALVGAKDAGKTHYIAVLINELMNRVGQRFDASLSALDETTIRRYRDEFKRQLFDQREVIKGTVTARARVETRYPLVYRLTFQRKRLLVLKRLQVSTLVFFDTAGEDLTDIDVMSTETRYLANSHGIIFLLDPLQIPTVRGQVEAGVPLPTENTEPQEIIGRVARLIRDCRGMRPDELIDTPVALAFSKIDAVRPLIEPGSPMHRASQHDGYFDLSDAEQVGDNLRALMSDWVGVGLDTFVRHNFSTYSYFGLSALGASPDRSGKLTRGVVPFRVEDPFLWILYRQRIVEGRRA